MIRLSVVIWAHLQYYVMVILISLLLLINSELNKIAGLLAVNELSLNVQKIKFMIFHYRQWVIIENDIPCPMMNNTLIERVVGLNFLGLTVNEYINWNSHTQKIVNKISRTLGVINMLKRYLPISAMKLMYDSLIVSRTAVHTLLRADFMPVVKFDLNGGLLACLYPII